MKLCKDCDLSSLDTDSPHDYSLCERRLTLKAISLVTGETLKGPLVSCFEERESQDVTRCGPGGKHWTPKEQ